MKVRIFAVIVLYKIAAADSISFRSLLQSAQLAGPETLDLAVLLYDNTPGAVAPEDLPAGVTYVHDASNSGLATAYNSALSMALEAGYEWLLTLDQDTELPDAMLSGLVRRAGALANRPDVAAIVPQIRAGGRIVSPNYFALGALPKWFESGYEGVPAETVYAFNSASMLRTRALRQCGGYSPWFWLDNSDSYIFRQLSKLGKRVYVAGSLEVDHDFSMLNMQERVSPERYATILMAESAFWDTEMNLLAGLERTGRLAGRLVKHARRQDGHELRRLTLGALLLRLFRSRTHRIALWRAATAARLGSALKGLPSPGRPAVSVCMAAYNGERYIAAQLHSILPQLRVSDEIVIVDDASRDTTRACVEQMRQTLADVPDAPRIVLIVHEENRGVVRTFEEAVRCATGDILFLCDDDDLWAPDKVEKMLTAFREHPEAQIVSTSLSLIDEDDKPIENSDFLRHRSFTPGLLANLIHNQFQGSALAFRAALVQHILPFPADRLFLHDVWIGTRNALAGGKVIFLDEPLLLYRRHSGNYSKRFSRWKQLRLRLELVEAHLRSAWHRL